MVWLWLYQLTLLRQCLIVGQYLILYTNITKESVMLKFNKDELKKMCLALKPDDKLQIVGDHGVYIMPTWKDGRTTKVGVVYAEGCSPTLNPDDFYDNKVSEFGGDDGADTIGNVIEMLKICFASKSHINVHLTPTQIKVSAG